MENFKGKGLAEIGARLGDPRQIIHGRENGTQITGFVDMPAQRGIGPGIEYRAKSITDQEADDRGQATADQWFYSALAEGNSRLTTRAKMWMAGSVAITSTIAGLVLAR